jgi:hypothetical protein
LQDVSGVSTVPQIPIFFVDSPNMESQETKSNMIQFHGWLASRNPLSTTQVREVALRDKIEEEFAEAVFVEYRTEGPPENQSRFAVYEDRKRQKITPYNGDQPRYDEWTVERRWEEPAGHQSVNIHTIQHEVEEKRVEHHNAHSFAGFSSHDHTHYTVIRKTWVEQWKETISFDGTVQKTNPVQVGGVCENVIRQDRERGFTQGYERVIS